jgi:hypothetical protein
MKTFATAADPQVVAALHKMQAPEMKPLLTFFEILSHETDVSLRRGDGTEMYRLQGRAMFLQDFLDAVKNSASVMEKLRK